MYFNSENFTCISSNARPFLTPLNRLNTNALLPWNVDTSPNTFSEIRDATNFATRYGPVASSNLFQRNRAGGKIVGIRNVSYRGWRFRLFEGFRDRRRFLSIEIPTSVAKGNRLSWKINARFHTLRHWIQIFDGVRIERGRVTCCTKIPLTLCVTLLKTFHISQAFIYSRPALLGKNHRRKPRPVALSFRKDDKKLYSNGIIKARGNNEDRLRNRIHEVRSTRDAASWSLERPRVVHASMRA